MQIQSKISLPALILVLIQARATHTYSCVPSSNERTPLPSHTVKEKHLITDLPAQARRPSASQPGTTMCPQVLRGPSDLHPSAHPGPDFSTASPQTQRQTVAQLAILLVGQWPANSYGKEGKEGTPQTNSGLPEPKHTLVRGLSQRAGVGGGLTPSLPA